MTRDQDSKHNAKMMKTMTGQLVAKVMTSIVEQNAHVVQVVQVVVAVQSVVLEVE